MNDIKEHVQELEKKIHGVSTKGLVNASEMVYLENCDELEKKYKGQFVAIDSEKRKIIEIGKTPVTTLKKAIKKSGQRKYYLRKIGEPTRMRV